MFLIKNVKDKWIDERGGLEMHQQMKSRKHVEGKAFNRSEYREGGRYWREDKKGYCCVSLK